jgi:predicted MFS family arabinose efflux permease
VTRRLFGTLCGLVFLFSFGRVAFAPLLETFRADFGVGPAAVGTVTTLVWVGSALPRIPVGYVLTRVPRRRVVLAAGVALAVATAFTGTATSLLAVQVGALAIGVASGAYYVAAVPLVGELYPERVGRAVGIHGMAAQVAAVVAPAGVVAVLALADWRAGFLALSAATLLVTVALVRAFGAAQLPAAAGADSDFRAALSHWRLILAGTALVVVAGFAWQGVFNFYVTYLLEVKGLSRGLAGALLTVVFAAGVPGFLLSGRLADRLPRVPYILSILVAFTACLFALTVVRGLAALVVVTVALGYVVHSLFPALDAYMLSALPPDNRASAYAVFTGLALLIEANGSGAVGALVGAGYGFDAVFRGFVLLQVVAIVGLGAAYLLGRFPGARSRERAAGDVN